MTDHLSNGPGERNSAAVLRTPDACFAQLPDYDFEPHYLQLAHPRYDSLRMHYVDEGDSAAPVVLMLHGEPSWSFAYRKVIARVVAAGYRAVAPDHIGFGRSDKLPQRTDYSYQLHVEAMASLLQQLNLNNIVLLCQDWGGPIGLRTLAQMPDRFAAVVASNTLLPNCEAVPRGVAGWPGAQIEDWVALCNSLDDLDVGAIVSGVSVSDLPADVVAAYNAPFPNASFKAGPLSFPGLIPLTPGSAGIAENIAAWEVLRRWHKPFVTAFADADPSARAWETVFLSQVPGAWGVILEAAGHFSQEEQPDALADVVLQVLESLP